MSAFPEAEYTVALSSVNANASGFCGATYALTAFDAMTPAADDNDARGGLMRLRADAAHIERPAWAGHFCYHTHDIRDFSRLKRMMTVSAYRSAADAYLRFDRLFKSGRMISLHLGDAKARRAIDTAILISPSSIYYHTVISMHDTHSPPIQ